jgi:hypothetical protein
MPDRLLTLAVLYVFLPGMNMRIPFRSSLVLLALALGACSTEVAVSPKGSDLATFKKNPLTHGLTMTGDVKGDIPSAFQASIRALGDLGYFHTGDSTDKTMVYGRGVLDVYVEIDLAQSVNAGMTTVKVYLRPGSLPDAQSVFSSIVDELNNPAAPHSRRGGS